VEGEEFWEEGGDEGGGDDDCLEGTGGEGLLEVEEGEDCGGGLGGLEGG